MAALVGCTNMHKGFANLKLPADMLAKMKHDLARIENDPMDTYAAFDFFVTAEHIVDWIYPDTPEKREKKKRIEIRTSNQLLSLVSHIANGNKHFLALDPNHQSVKEIEKNACQPKTIRIRWASYRAVDDPKLLKYLAKTQIPLEISPCSNYRLKVTPPDQPHPIRALVDAGVFCTVNSDDPAMFSTDLTNEYLLRE